MPNALDMRPSQPAQPKAAAPQSQAQKEQAKLQEAARGLLKEKDQVFQKATSEDLSLPVEQTTFYFYLMGDCIVVFVVSISK